MPQSRKTELNLRLKPGQHLELNVRTTAPKTHPPAPSRFTRILAASKRLLTPQALFFLGLAVYLLTRLVALPSFPIYFGSDEAMTVMRAADLLRDGFRDYRGQLLPTLFLNDNKFSLGTTVYLQVLPLLFFARSIWAARIVSVLVCLLGTYWFGRILTDCYRLPYGWMGVFFLVIAPAWFIFSRTVYETAQMTSFFAGFLYYYLLYRQKDPRYLFPALVLGAVAFYTYLPAQIIVVATGLMLLISDFRYHWEQRRITFKGEILIMILAIPLVRFLLTTFSQYMEVLPHYQSYWATDIPWTEKVGTYLANYINGLSPWYWFLPYTHEHIAYRFDSLSHILVIFLPFALWGVWLLLKRWKQPESRLPFFVLLATPIAGSLLHVEITRVLAAILPWGIFTVVGFSVACEWIEQHGVRRFWLNASTALIFTLTAIFLLRAALVSGPTWFTNYGLSGMQYGAGQLFPAMQQYRAEHPDTTLYASGGWIWQTDTVMRFFISDDDPMVRLGTPDQVPERIMDGEDLVFVVIPSEYDALVASGDYADIQVLQTIPYPDGTPGFRFIRLTLTPAYMAEVQAEIARENAPVTATLPLAGTNVTATLSPINSGVLENLFDGDESSLVRSMANPLTLDLVFAEPQSLSGVEVRVGAEPIHLTLVLHFADGSPAITQTMDAGTVDDYKNMLIAITEASAISSLHLEVQDSLSPPDSPVHVWEVRLIQP